MIANAIAWSFNNESNVVVMFVSYNSIQLDSTIHKLPAYEKKGDFICSFKSNRIWQNKTGCSMLQINHWNCPRPIDESKEKPKIINQMSSMVVNVALNRLLLSPWLHIKLTHWQNLITYFFFSFFVHSSSTQQIKCNIFTVPNEWFGSINEYSNEKKC